MRLCKAHVSARKDAPHRAEVRDTRQKHNLIRAASAFTLNAIIAMFAEFMALSEKSTNNQITRFDLA